MGYSLSTTNSNYLCVLLSHDTCSHVCVFSHCIETAKEIRMVFGTAANGGQCYTVFGPALK